MLLVFDDTALQPAGTRCVASARYSPLRRRIQPSEHTMSIEKFVDHMVGETIEQMDGDTEMLVPEEGSTEEDALIDKLRDFFTGLAEAHRRK